MKFEFLISIDVKNDGITRESDPEDLEIILQDLLLINHAIKLPWVIHQDIKVITRDTRE
jgi:hypothetical protein